jgi:hypothetical protein
MFGMIFDCSKVSNNPHTQAYFSLFGIALCVTYAKYFSMQQTKTIATLCRNERPTF